MTRKDSLGKGHGANFQNAEKFYIATHFDIFKGYKHIFSFDLPLRFVSLSPNAGGGNYEYLAVVSDSLTRTNLAWKVGVEQSL